MYNFNRCPVKLFRLVLALVAVTTLSSTATAASRAHLPDFSTRLPFSFTYDDISSDELLKKWPHDSTTRKSRAGTETVTDTWTDPKTKLVVRSERVSYPEGGAVEWTLYFTNTGPADSKVLEKVRAIDHVIEVEKSYTSFNGLALHHFLGAQTRYDDFRPEVSLLDRDSTLNFSPSGGRSSTGVAPYFILETNLRWSRSLQSTEAPENGGIVMAVGWPGQWKAQYSVIDDKRVRISAGQENLSCTLRPGETVRSPLIALLKYSGDWIDGQNAWRRWMFDHNIPKSADGTAIPPLNVPSSSPYFQIMEKATVQNQIAFIDGYLDAGIDIDYWWMDAGWYPMPVENRWPNTGTWEVDRKRFPNGLRPISDHAHSRDVGTILWFEPERVTPGTWLYENRKEWLLTSGTRNNLVNLGIPEASAWLAERIDRIMTKEGIDIYRQDFNTSPLALWIANDEPGRTGITENKYIQGHLWFLDELKRRRPGLIIDLCASGGRRHDLESLRRGIVLTQSDFVADLADDTIFLREGIQNINYSTPFLMPYHGAGVRYSDPYGFWSCATPAIHPYWDVRQKTPETREMAQRAKVWREVVAPCYFGDYYPLSPYTTSTDSWMGFQYNHATESRGVVKVFRRATAADSHHVFRLRGLAKNKTYEMVFVDGTGTDVASSRVSGDQLMETGIEVHLPTRAGVSIISFRQVP